MFDLTRRNFSAILLAASVVVLPQTVLADGHAHQVTIQGFAFVPASLEVAVGDTITFTNADGAPHTATALDGSFDTERLNKGDSASVTISAAGEIAFKCAFHPAMQGVVTAQ